MTRANVVIIWSGQGGVPLAAALAECGRSVVLFERGALGGAFRQMFDAAFVNEGLVSKRLASPKSPKADISMPRSSSSASAGTSSTNSRTETSSR